MSVSAKAIWYIESHLGGDLSLDSIARDVGVSRYHLSRAFNSATGCGLALYVRGRRLSEAARWLLNGAPDILSLSLDTGYGSHEAFTRAFRQQFGLTPEQARAQRPANLKLMEPIKMSTSTVTPIAPARIARREAMLIFGLSHSYTSETMGGIPSQWERFLAHLGTIGNRLDKSPTA